MRISKEGVAFIASFESFVSKPYLDTGDVPTIGYGTTIYPNGKKVKMSDKPITEAEALAYKMYHIEKRCYPYIDVVLNQNQFDAICSFVYNVGGEAFRTSTLRKKIIANAPYEEIKEQFLRWNRDNGKVVNGLTKRREKEAQLYGKPIELLTQTP